MARQFTDAPGLMQAKTDGIFLEEGPNIQKVDLSEKLPDIDFESEIKKMASEAKKHKEDESTKILKDDIFDSKIITEEELQKISPVDRQINEIKGLIKLKKYKEALVLIEKAMAVDKNRQELFYLKAYCQTFLNNEIDALRTLSIIRDANLGELETSVNSLIETIRGRMQVMLLIEIDLQVAPSRVIGQLMDLTQLDQDFEFYHFLLSYLLMLLRKYGEAFDQVTHGLNLVHEKRRARLNNLKMDIERRWLQETLRPAIIAYKEGNYNQSKKNLRDVDFRLHANKSFALFAQHINALSGGGLFKRTSKQSPTQIKIPGSPKDRDLLESMIVSDDIAVGLQLLRQGQIDRAIHVFQNALNFASDYPYLNYMYAGTILNLCVILRMTKQVGNIDAIVQHLSSAQKSAKIALNDKTIQDAQFVAASLEQQLKYFNSIKEIIKKIEREAKLVNSLIKEFVGIMETAKGGLKSIEMFDDVFKRMKGLEKRTEDAKKEVESEQGKKHVKELETAIRNNMKTLNEIKSDIDHQKREGEMVQAIGQEYRRIMDGIKNGLESPEHADRVERDLRQLRNNISTTKSRLTIKQAIEEVDKLDAIISENLTQLKKAKASAGTGVTLKEKNFIEEKAKSFKACMDMLNSGQQIDRQGVEMFVNVFQSIVDDIKKEMPSMRSKEAKEVIQQLKSNVESVLSQLRGYL